MKKIFFGALLLAMIIAVPFPAMARVDVSVNIGLPPLVFAAPPAVIVLPYTSGVYVVPEIDAELYFWNGWWWRLWEGRWYRSHYYDRGWSYYYNVPTFYFDVDPGWRGYYYDRNWYGQPWNYELVPHRRLQANWRNWNTNRYWERQRSWGVQDLRPIPRQQRQELRQQRQQEYRQRPDVQRQIQPQRRQPQGQQQMQPRARQQQGQQQMQPRSRQQQDQPQGRQQMQPRARQQQDQQPAEPPVRKRQ